jgi:hypothetical protein
VSICLECVQASLAGRSVCLHSCAVQQEIPDSELHISASQPAVHCIAPTETDAQLKCHGWHALRYMATAVIRSCGIYRLLIASEDSARRREC